MTGRDELAAARVRRRCKVEAPSPEEIASAWDDFEPSDLMSDLELERAGHEPIGTCEHCHEAIEHGQPYMGRIPFIGSWGGFVHRQCPPRLRLVRDGARG